MLESGWIFGWLFLVLVTKAYLKMTEGRCRSKRRLDGMTALITGANCGLGLEAARNLARRGARVVLACRNEKKANQARDDILASTGNNNVVVSLVDLSSMKSVVEFSENILRTESRLDILVCNAGMMSYGGGKREVTEDNTEVQFASNVLGHFLMINILLELIKKTKDSRIVIVSSVLHLMGTLDWNNLQMESSYRNPLAVYSTNKLLDILITKELHRRLLGTGVIANALHPGGVITNIGRNSGWAWSCVISPLYYFFMKSAELGAETIEYLAVSEEVNGVSGKYFSDNVEGWLANSAKNPENAKKAWDICENLCRPFVENANGVCNNIFSHSKDHDN